MKAHQLVITAQTKQRRKGRRRCRVSFLQLSKCPQIGLGRGIVKLISGERFECRQRFAAPTQQKVANGPPREPGNASRNTFTDADASTELLVRRFETSGDVHGVAVGCVVEVVSPAEIPNNRGTRIQPETRRAEDNALRPPALAKRLGTRIQIEGASNRARRMVPLLPRSPEQDMHSVPNNLHDGSA